jgi:hypothetical protein
MGTSHQHDRSLRFKKHQKAPALPGFACSCLSPGVWRGVSSGSPRKTRTQPQTPRQPPKATPQRSVPDAPNSVIAVPTSSRSRIWPATHRRPLSIGSALNCNFKPNARLQPQGGRSEAGSLLGRRRNCEPRGIVCKRRSVPDRRSWRRIIFASFGFSREAVLMLIGMALLKLESIRPGVPLHFIEACFV